MTASSIPKNTHESNHAGSNNDALQRDFAHRYIVATTRHATSYMALCWSMAVAVVVMLVAFAVLWASLDARLDDMRHMHREAMDVAIRHADEFRKTSNRVEDKLRDYYKAVQAGTNHGPLK